MLGILDGESLALALLLLYCKTGVFSQPFCPCPVFASRPTALAIEAIGSTVYWVYGIYPHFLAQHTPLYDLCVALIFLKLLVQRGRRVTRT